jgi:large subunit ribosomal protein L5e
MKGALDGGLHVPHSTKKLFGYDREKKELDSGKLRHIIFGGHVADYMQSLSKNNPSRYKKQFSRYIKENVTPEGLEAMYKKAHLAIRKSPTLVKTKKNKPRFQKRHHKKRLTAAQRKIGVQTKLNALKRAQKSKSKSKKADQ